MYWRRIGSQTWHETGAAKPRAIVPAFVTTLSTYLSQWKLGVRPSFQLTLICISIGLATYALILVGEFTFKFFRTIGRDQDSKQAGIEDSIRQLAKLLHPELSSKAQRAIDTLEERIREADAVFSKWPVTEEGLSTWTTQTEMTLARTIGQGSDWFERLQMMFANNRAESK